MNHNKTQNLHESTGVAMTPRELWELTQHQSYKPGKCPDPDPDGISYHGGSQCPAMDGGYRCTFREGHTAVEHKTWNKDRYVRIWVDN
jgi:hypothetical protein